MLWLYTKIIENVLVTVFCQNGCFCILYKNLLNVKMFCNEGQVFHEVVLHMPKIDQNTKILWKSSLLCYHRFQREFSINVWVKMVGDNLISPYELPRRLKSVFYVNSLWDQFLSLLEYAPSCISSTGVLDEWRCEYLLMSYFWQDKLVVTN